MKERPTAHHSTQRHTQTTITLLGRWLLYAISGLPTSMYMAIRRDHAQRPFPGFLIQLQQAKLLQTVPLCAVGYSLALISSRCDKCVAEVLCPLQLSATIESNCTASSVIVSLQVPVPNVNLFLCFGAVVEDGYGVCYNPQEKQVLFSVSSYHHNPHTHSQQYMIRLSQSLQEMKDVLVASR